MTRFTNGNQWPGKLKFAIVQSARILNLLSVKKQKENAAHARNRLLIFSIGILIVHASIAQTVPAQNTLGPYTEQLRTENPLRESVNFAYTPAPVTIDFDHDGDIDVMVADFDGGNGFHLLRNDGTRENPAFNYALYWDNPFNFIAFDDGATASFSDIDRDGDKDMLLGILDGTFRFYKHNPEATYKYSLQNSAWNATTKTGNPFYGVDLGEYASPAFIDMDNDGDDDMVVGTSYLPNNKSFYYFVNDGNSNFTEASITGINAALEQTTPVFIDVDRDGAKDIVIGAANGNVYYFRRTGTTSFEEQTGVNNPFNGFNKGPYSSPAAADFDNDGDDDLIVGAQNTYQDIFFFENKGNSVFEEKIDFDNAFGGIDVGQEASPYFIDFDNDGDQDVVIGNRAGSIATLTYVENTNGSFKVHTSTNPFNGLSIPASFVPSFVDLDGDGDKDLIGGVADHQASSIEYYKNENGTYVRQPFASGPFKNITIAEGKTDFVDIDNDGDQDLFISEAVPNGWDAINYIRFYKNTGTPQAPAFTAMTGTDNPLSQVVEQYQLFPRFTDIDHDGDMDALIGEGGNVIENADGNEFSYYENTGTKTTPVFTYRGDLIPQGDNPYEPSPSFADYDNDGDLDVFTGGLSGTLTLFKNTNQFPTISVDAQPVIIHDGVNSTLIDPQLILSDADNDAIVYATISIGSFQPGKEALSFSSISGITGSFDEATGVLTFKGKATVADYQAILRTVTYSFSEESASGRQRPQKLSTIVRNISILAIDADGTNAATVVKTINIVSGQPPVFADNSILISANSIASVPLAALITDGDNNIDLSTLSIVMQPASGAVATLTAGQTLSVDYSLINFAGTETVQLSICDTDGNCDQSAITITVNNTAPVFQNQSVVIPFAGSAMIDLKPLIADAENNADLTSLTVAQSPASGALVSIDANANLLINYSQKIFAGTEAFAIQICDKVSACTQNIISVTVNNTAPLIQPPAISVASGATYTINLLQIISDPDDNLDAASIIVSTAPSSGASAAIETVSANEINLSLNYSGLTFSGQDQVSVRACDVAGLCTESVMLIQVEPEPYGQIEVFNAVAPNSSGDNHFMRITNLSQTNKVSIFNRWGDEVFSIDDYDHNVSGKRFEGISGDGNMLPSGTYFYKVEYFDERQTKQTLTGYLSLKQ